MAKNTDNPVQNPKGPFAHFANCAVQPRLVELVAVDDDAATGVAAGDVIEVRLGLLRDLPRGVLVHVSDDAALEADMIARGETRRPFPYAVGAKRCAVGRRRMEAVRAHWAALTLQRQTRAACEQRKARLAALGARRPSLDKAAAKIAESLASTLSTASTKSTESTPT